MTPFEAALKGAREIGFTILSITVSLVAVFIPVLLMGGVVGRVFHEFAVTVTIAIASSAFVSLTLAPMLAARLPAERRSDGKQRRNLFERSFDRVTAGYAVLLDLCLRARPLVFLVFLGSVVATVWHVPRHPERLLPAGGYRPALRADPRRARTSRSPPCWSCRPGRGGPRSVRRTSRTWPRSSAAAGPTSTLNNGRIFVELKPKGERARLGRPWWPTCAASGADPRHELVHRARAEPAASAAARARASTSSSCRVSSGTSSTTGRCGWPTACSATRPFTDVTDDSQNTALQARIDIDRDKAAGARHHRRAAPLDALHAASARARSRRSTPPATATR